MFDRSLYPAGSNGGEQRRAILVSMGVAVVLRLVTAAWVLAEAVLVARERRHRNAPARLDRRSFPFLMISIGVGIVLANVFRDRSGGAGPRLTVALGLVVAGLVLRFWAVRTLGRSFRVVVAIGEGQQLITGGPYRFVRHPSYTGLLVALLGVGIANGTIMSVAAAFVLPLPAVVWRIRIEETALAAAFGADWRDYADHTRRLLPGAW